MTFAAEQELTDRAVARWEAARDPRLRQMMTALVRHCHAFVHEVQPTHEEWLVATEYLSALGQISDDKRKECILLSDVLGISMLVVLQNSRKPSGATPDTVLGPFHIDDSPLLDHGGDLAGSLPGEPVYISGTVRDVGGQPLPNVLLDIWQADEEGTYEAQIPDCSARLRALQYSDGNGRYGFWTIAPKGYSIPMDGPVGALIEQTDISPYRPAHVHFLLTAPGYQPLVTHIFREGAEYLDTDVVFGARDELVVRFVPNMPRLAPDGKSMSSNYLTVDFDFVLAEAVGDHSRSVTERVAVL
jgi:hydroxyquinol 1,2-dioxygenase